MEKSHPILYEPTTAITDFIIFVLGCYFGWSTFYILGSTFHLLWSITFFVLSIGALLGGISHGFGPRFSKLEKKVLWILTLIFVGLSALMLLLSVLMFFINGSIGFLIIFLFVFLFVFYIYTILKNDSFLIAIKFYLPILIGALFCFLYTFINKGYTGSLFISIGLIVTLVASLVQMSKITLHKYFNYNDFFHVLQIIGMYLMYEGGLEIPKI